jgi:hypothetical protein
MNGIADLLKVAHLEALQYHEAVGLSMQNFLVA